MINKPTKLKIQSWYMLIVIFKALLRSFCSYSSCFCVFLYFQRLSVSVVEKFQVVIRDTYRLMEAQILENHEFCLVEI